MKKKVGEEKKGGVEGSVREWEVGDEEAYRRRKIY